MPKIFLFKSAVDTKIEASEVSTSVSKLKPQVDHGTDIVAMCLPVILSTAARVLKL